MLMRNLLVLAVVFWAAGRSDGGTVAYWRFEEGANGSPASGAGSILDSSGNQLHGTPGGDPIYDGEVALNPIPQTGQANLHSLAFGGRQSIAIPDNPDF